MTLTLSEAFVGTDVEARQPIRSEVAYTTFVKSTSEAALTDFWTRMRAATFAASMKLQAERTPKTFVKNDGYETFRCAGCSRKAFQRPGRNRTHCRPCERGGK